METTLNKEMTPDLTGGVAKKNGAQPRKSGIELLKIIGMLLIVFSHVTCTVTGNHIPASGLATNFIIDVHASTDITLILLEILSCTGLIGNAIFFTCSAWFLLDKGETNIKRMLRLVGDLFVIAVSWLIAMLIYKGPSTFTVKEIIRSLLPFYFSQNWYVTYYVLFCFMAPFLNIILEAIDQKKHLAVCMVLFTLYLFLSVAQAYPGSGNLTIWVSVYFILGYFKKYGTGFINSKKANVIALLGSIAVIILLYLVTNFAGLKIGFLYARVKVWTKNCNFLFFVLAFSALNLMNRTKFTSKLINFVSSLTLIIYLLHDNYWMQHFIKPEHWIWIYNNLGYNLFWVWYLAYGFALFLVSALIAAIYRLTLQKLVHFLADKICSLACNIVFLIRDKLLAVIK